MQHGGVLALDLATRAGWALWKPGEPVRHGIWAGPQTGDDVGRFIMAFEDWLQPFLAAEQPSWVVFEAPILTAGKTTPATARKLMSIAAVCEVVCRRGGVMYRQANNKAVRKHFIGHGNLRSDESKRRTLEVCRAKGWAPRDHNAADALALLDYAVTVLALEVPWQTGAWFEGREPA